MLDLLLLPSLRRFSSVGVFLLRLMAGALLLSAVWAIAFDPKRLAGYATFLAQFHFPLPALCARLTVYAQLFAGTGLVIGLFTRWAGILCAINFALLLAMIDRHTGGYGVFASASLTGIGLFFATHGSGRYGLDEWLERHSSSSAWPRGR